MFWGKDVTLRYIQFKTAPPNYSNALKTVAVASCSNHPTLPLSAKTSTLNPKTLQL